MWCEYDLVKFNTLSSTKLPCVTCGRFSQIASQILTLNMRRWQTSIISGLFTNICLNQQTDIGAKLNLKQCTFPHKHDKFCPMFMSWRYPLLFVTEFCECVFTAHRHACSWQTCKIRHTPLCLCVHITLSAIIIYLAKSPSTYKTVCSNCLLFGHTINPHF